MSVSGGWILHFSLGLHDPEVKALLAKHPRFKLHFIPTGSSWLNLIERWFAHHQ